MRGNRTGKFREDLMDRAERVDGLPNDIAALKLLIDERMALAHEPAPARTKVRT